MRIVSSVVLGLGLILGGVCGTIAGAAATAEVSLPTGTGRAGLAAFATSVADGSEDRALDLDANGRVDQEDVLLAARRVMRADPAARGASEDTAGVLLFLRNSVLSAPR